jgi:hypothetical protein
LRETFRQSSNRIANASAIEAGELGSRVMGITRYRQKHREHDTGQSNGGAGIHSNLRLA